jgi:hypothetical protein
VPTLIVENGYSAGLHGLGSRKPFAQLGQERITKAVRAVLRRQFGIHGVEVSSEARFTNGNWRGRCIVFGLAWAYSVQEWAANVGEQAPLGVGNRESRRAIS